MRVKKNGSPKSRLQQTTVRLRFGEPLGTTAKDHKTQNFIRSGVAVVSQFGEAFCHAVGNIYMYIVEF